MAKIIEIDLKNDEAQKQLLMNIEIEYGADEPACTYSVAVKLYSADKTRSVWLPQANFQTTPEHIVVPTDSLCFHLHADLAEILEKTGPNFCVEVHLVEQKDSHHADVHHTQMHFD